MAFSTSDSENEGIRFAIISAVTGPRISSSEKLYRPSNQINLPLGQDWTARRPHAASIDHACVDGAGPTNAKKPAAERQVIFLGSDPTARRPTGKVPAGGMISRLAG